MFKEKFIKLCNQKKESPSSVCYKVGITPATYSKWTDESIPRKATLMRIADYFGVTVDYLLEKDTQKEKPTDNSEPLKENVVIFHRNGQTVTKEYTAEQMELIAKLLDEIPEKPKNI